MQAAAGTALEPSRGQECAGERCGQRAGKVRSPLRPIQAGAGEHASAGAQLVKIYVHGGKEGLAGWGEGVVSTVVGVQGPNGEQSLSKLNAAAASEMVIAGAGLGHGARVAVLAQGPDRDGRGDLGERLEDRTDVRAGELVVAVASLDPHPDEAAVDQAA